MFSFDSDINASVLFGVSDGFKPIYRQYTQSDCPICELYLDYYEYLPDFISFNENFDESEKHINKIFKSYIDIDNVEDLFVVVGIQFCNRCDVVKKILKNKNIDFVSIDFDSLDNYSQQNYMNIASSNSNHNFPLIFKNNKLITIKEI
jgi:glutaredoxin